MREIEFRAWLKHRKKMIEVEEISFIGQKQIAYDEIEYRYTDKEPFHYTQWVDFDGIELMQYTGFKDKNGVKIFEGDIVKTPNRKGKIQFIWSGWYFHTDKDGFVELHDVTDIIKVIGNIYENKELLE